MLFTIGNKFSVLVIIVIFAFVANSSIAQQLTGEDIIEKVDLNMTSSTVFSKSRMIIHKGKRIDTKEMSSWGEGAKKGFAVFNAPARDKGTKYLRMDDNLWMYLPSVEKVVKISGHLLRQSMMGSDFSYEDNLNRSKMLDDYSVFLEGDEEVDGSLCYVLELTAKHKEVTYYRRKIWVDKKTHVSLKADMYAKTGKLLKQLTVQKVEQINDRFYPTHMTMVDKLKKNSKTEFIVDEIQFDVKLPSNTFTRRNLEKR